MIFMPFWFIHTNLCKIVCGYISSLLFISSLKYIDKEHVSNKIFILYVIIYLIIFYNFYLIFHECPPDDNWVCEASLVTENTTVYIVIFKLQFLLNITLGATRQDTHVSYTITRASIMNPLFSPKSKLYFRGVDAIDLLTSGDS